MREMNALPFSLFFPRPEAAITPSGNEDLFFTGQFQKTLEELDEELDGKRDPPSCRSITLCGCQLRGVIFLAVRESSVGGTQFHLKQAWCEGRAGEHSSGDCFPSGPPTVLWRGPKAAQMLSMALILHVMDSTHIKKKFSSPQMSLGNTG